MNPLGLAQGNSYLLPPLLLGDKAEALDLYSRGVRELEKGVALEISVEGADIWNAVCPILCVCQLPSSLMWCQHITQLFT